MIDRLFLYGTLRPGQVAYHLLAANVARSEPATVPGIIHALPMGYPGYLSGGGVVVGELVWLTDVEATLRRLDEYEGDEFSRVVCSVKLHSGQEVLAWIYAFTDDALGDATIIESGDWVRHCSARD